MKNKEKFANEIIDLALKCERIAILDGKPIACDSNRLECLECWRDDGTKCKELTEWGEQEYIEQPEIDWSKVPVDTPIYVKNIEGGEWNPRYFAKYENGKVFAWGDGKTSFTTKGVSEWKYAKLADQQKEEQQEEETDDEATAKVDWSKVPVDTPILVSINGKNWHKRYFCKYDKEKVYAWENGATSWSALRTYDSTSWTYAKLAEPQKEETTSLEDATRRIKEYCIDREDCKGCEFEGENGFCVFGKAPESWEV